MKRIKAFLIKHSGILAAAAFIVGVSSMHSACYMVYHQPKVPMAMDEYRK